MDTRRVLVLNPCMHQQVVDVGWDLFDQLSFLVDVARLMAVDFTQTQTVPIWAGTIGDVTSIVEIMHEKARPVNKVRNNKHINSFCGTVCVVASTSSPAEQAEGLRIFEDVDHFMSLDVIRQALQLYQSHTAEVARFREETAKLRRQLHELPVDKDAVRVKDDLWRERLLEEDNM